MTAEPWGGGIALPALSDELTPDADSWNRLGATGAIATLDDWVVAASDRLADAARRAPGAVAGDRLVHLDCRADNILIDAHSVVWLVDWPWASTGAAWFDALTYLLDLLVEDPAAEVEPLLRHPVFATATDAAIDAVLAAVAGSWIERSREPAPPDLPTLRSFQRREADAALAWLRRRWDEPAPDQR